MDRAIKNMGCDLTNTTKGGEGGTRSGWKHSEETKRKMSLSAKGKKKIFSEEHRKKCIEQLNKVREEKFLFKKGQIPWIKGIGFSEEQKEKLRNINKSNMAVCMFDLEGNYIKTFRSMKEAGRQTESDYACIQRCCMGRQKTSKGYVWKFEKDCN